MKIPLLPLAGFAFACAATAQTAPPGPGLPPPGIDDPGVKASPVKPAQATPAATPAPAPATQPSPATTDEMPEVSVHRRGDTTIQESRRSGQVYMVVITPRGGVPQTPRRWTWPARRSPPVPWTTAT